MSLKNYNDSAMNLLGEDEVMTIAARWSWINYEAPTREATWVCTKCEYRKVPCTADSVDYLMEFEARNSHTEGLPSVRKVTLRTSEFRMSEPGFIGFLSLVITGQLIETDPWDRSVEVYERD
jgi:hypothetical protein